MQNSKKETEDRDLFQMSANDTNSSSNEDYI